MSYRFEICPRVLAKQVFTSRYLLFNLSSLFMEQKYLNLELKL
ncbi:hypothetical protein BofuT4_P070700.1 [Botrytis cinerea T4]|uniref:Uncharacterized protein n=1 Tax=Botryotinia fuckeliana (strain T4) TaxID=999810 RepID=G2XQA6_BOTF4|nr:hypothetical protein BofuT4_P070700.1 [Botrytis cinerea T4]